MMPSRQSFTAMLGAAIGLLAIGSNANAGFVTPYTNCGTVPGKD